MSNGGKRSKAQTELRQALQDLDRHFSGERPRHGAVLNLRKAVEAKLEAFQAVNERAVGILDEHDSQRVDWNDEYEALRAQALEQITSANSWLEGNPQQAQSDDAPSAQDGASATVSDNAVHEELERLRRELHETQEAYRKERIASQRLLDEQTAPRRHVSDRDSDAGSRQSRDDISTPSSQSEGFSALAETLQRGFALPQPVLPSFEGDPLTYNNFVCCFETVIEARVADSRARLMYLIQQCHGGAKRAIEMCTLVQPASDGYKKAREILKSRYGRTHHVARACVEKIIEGPALKASDVKGLADLALDMQRTSVTLSATGYSGDVDNTQTLKRLVRRLPNYLRQRWVDVALDIMDNGSEPRFDDLARFVEAKARAANSMYGLELHTQEAPRSNHADASRNGGRHVRRHGRQGMDHSQGRRTTTLQATSTPHQLPSTQRVQARSTCSLCGGNCAFLDQCQLYKAKSIADRRKLLNELHRCHNCLLSGHDTTSCMKQGFCKINGCQQKHHYTVHEPTARPSQVTCASAQSATSCFTGVVPVRVNCQGKECFTYALLDDGSDRTLCSERLLDVLKVTGESVTYDVTGINRECVNYEGRSVDLSVSPADGTNRKLDIKNVWSMKKLHIDVNSRPRQTELSKWAHLHGVTVTELPSNATVTLLIGTDVPEAHVPLECKSGSECDPYAVRTALGWAVRGPRDSAHAEQVRQPPATTCYIKTDVINQQLQSMWTTDFTEAAEDLAAQSVDDKRALIMMENSIERAQCGRYQVSLPWRDKTCKLPESRHMAEKRLRSLQRRLQRDSEAHKLYTETIEDYIHQGHAELAPSSTQPQKLWYLPHHAVTNPNKAGKIRVVFDAAATSGGQSLNDALLQGPDLLNELVGVLMRLRQGRVAISGDIKQMFHQVRVKPEDRDALRFLWWPGGDLALAPVAYRMCVHVFGARSSPSVANFALRQSALDQRGQFNERVIKTVLNDFYVDDCLTSTDTDEEARKLIYDVSLLLQQRGFKITKWASNSLAALEGVAPEDQADGLKKLQPNGEQPALRALGLSWNAISDTFMFNVTESQVPLTRRGILSDVSSLFDPLGLVAPVLLPAKQLLQEMCRRNLAWDDQLPDELQGKWTEWRSRLRKLQQVRIPRWYAADTATPIQRVDLHVFCDASEEGYGASAYLRLVDAQLNVTCVLVEGKSRVAPVKKQTLPRLELQAAVVGARLSRHCLRQLTLDVSSTTLWSDSTVTLGYIKNTSRRFKTFVANRLAVIHDLTQPTQWRHVPGPLNPADFASRGIAPNDTDALRMWARGPEFLKRPSSEWPSLKKPIPDVANNDEEIKREATAAIVKTDTAQKGLAAVIASYSGWYRLVRAAAWLRRLGRWHARQSYTPTALLSMVELRDMENALVKFVQGRVYGEERSALMQCKKVKAKSSLSPLCPQLRDGIIVVGGRLQHSPLSEGQKHPIVLPRNHHLTRLIIQEVHERNEHAGPEHVLQQLREQYWVPQGRAAVRGVLSRCAHCKRLKTSTMSQQMAPLLQEQVTPDEYPFSCVGVDFFGPMLIKERRSTLKRYGCVFSCLASRAVHLEMTESMTADSFICAIERFGDRRGKPRKIYSDNGTNLVGGEREMREALAEWNEFAIDRKLKQAGIDWVFNPPHASHRNGATERIIRSLRKVMLSVAAEQLLTNEQLRTVMTKAERVVNDRPLTAVSTDLKDETALTPSHLLLLRSNSCAPLGIFTAVDKYARRRWRQAQYAADIFWKRWIKEYLPTLQTRQKWSQSEANVQLGDLVLMKDTDCPRGRWPLARIVKLQPSRDGLVRGVDVKCRGKVYSRPITQLCKLEADEP